MSTGAALARRLHVGCGPRAAAGWLNVDLRRAPGVDLLADLRAGLALREASFDAAVAIHVLQDLAYLDVAPALAEIRRVLRPGALLRLGLPDLDRAIDAYRRGDGRYFYVPDRDARSVGRKLVAQITWYGSVRTPFTFDCIEELLHETGYRDVRGCGFRETRAPALGLVAFDDRERETLFVEAEAP